MTHLPLSPARRLPRAATAEPAWMRRLLIAGTLGLLGLLVLAPLAAVFAEALRDGLAAAVTALATATRWPRSASPSPWPRWRCR